VRSNFMWSYRLMDFRSVRNTLPTGRPSTLTIARMM
jgi:hypothetical protein